MSGRVRAWMDACAYACVHASLDACVYACVRACELGCLCVCVRACERASLDACVYACVRAQICISVTSHALNPLPLSQTVTPSRTPSTLERDVLYGRPLTLHSKNHSSKHNSKHKTQLSMPTQPVRK